MRVDFVLGTRPEAVKLSIPIIHFRADSTLDVRVISTGQHKEMLAHIFDWFDIIPDVELEVMQVNQSLGQLTANVLSGLNDVYSRAVKPDWIVVQGDTTSAFCGALFGYYNKVKVAHVEAGLRTFDKFSPWPEEMNRLLISNLADLHFAPTKQNAENLLKEGVPPEKIIVTGNTVIDALLHSLEKIERNKSFPADLAEYFVGEYSDQRVVLITGHRRENFGAGFANICYAIRKLATDFPSVHFIYPVHLNPNVQHTVNEVLGDSKLKNIRLTRPLNYEDFISLMNRSSFILTDSGGVQEEAPGLGKPVLVLRRNTERPEAVEYGTVKLVGTDVETIVTTSSKLLTDALFYNSMAKATNPYGDGTAASQILRAIKSCHPPLKT